MRPLSSADIVERAIDTLKGRARVKRAMWSRRAQEYEQKINSGDLISIAEVVRDLHRNDDQREQSYSERQLYEAALERLTREVAAVNGIEEVQGAAARRRGARRSRRRLSRLLADCGRRWPPAASWRAAGQAYMSCSASSAVPVIAGRRTEGPRPCRRPCCMPQARQQSGQHQRSEIARIVVSVARARSRLLGNGRVPEVPPLAPAGVCGHMPRR